MSHPPPTDGCRDLSLKEKALSEFLQRKFALNPSILQLIEKICKAKDGNLPHNRGIPSLRSIERFLTYEKASPRPFWKLIPRPANSVVPEGQHPDYHVVPVYPIALYKRMIAMWHDRYVNINGRRTKTNIWSFTTTLSQVMWLSWLIEENLWQRMMSLDGTSGLSFDNSFAVQTATVDNESPTKRRLLLNKQLQVFSNPVIAGQGTVISCFHYPFVVDIPPPPSSYQLPRMERADSLVRAWIAHTLRVLYTRPALDPASDSIESFVDSPKFRGGTISWMMPRVVSGGQEQQQQQEPQNAKRPTNNLCAVTYLPVSVTIIKPTSRRTNKRKHKLGDPVEIRAAKVLEAVPDTLWKCTDPYNGDPNFFDAAEHLPKYLFDYDWKCERLQCLEEKKEQLAKAQAKVNARQKQQLRLDRFHHTQEAAERTHRMQVEAFLKEEQAKHDAYEAQRFLGEDEDPMMQQKAIGDEDSSAGMDALPVSMDLL